jgi:hypothetical protein
VTYHDHWFSLKNVTINFPHCNFSLGLAGHGDKGLTFHSSGRHQADVESAESERPINKSISLLSNGSRNLKSAQIFANG